MVRNGFGTIGKVFEVLPSDLCFLNACVPSDQNLSSYIGFMENNYGPNFSYQDFATDFTAELFNASQWALLFRDSGAR